MADDRMQSDGCDDVARHDGRIQQVERTNSCDEVRRAPPPAAAAAAAAGCRRASEKRCATCSPREPPPQLSALVAENFSLMQHGTVAAVRLSSPPLPRQPVLHCSL